MHHQNVSLQNAPSKRTLLTSLKRSKAGPPQLKRSKKYVLMVHFAVIRFDGASGACQIFEVVFYTLWFNTFISATDPPLFLGADTCRDPGEVSFVSVFGRAFGRF